MINNPLIERYLYSTLRPKQLWIYVTVYSSIILLMVFINFFSYAYDSIEKLCQSLFSQFLAFQFIVLFVWSTYNSGTAIKEEITNKSFDFFRMFPVPAYKKALGIIIGKNLLVFIFAAINMLLIVLFGFAGGISLNLLGQILLTFFSIAVFMNFFALLLSTNSNAKRRQSSSPLLLLLVIFFVVPALLNLIMMMSEISKLKQTLVYFFDIRLPVLLLISSIAVYFSCWMFKGILRRFNLERGSLFTQKGAILFLLGFITITTGLYYNYLSMDESVVYSYWTITLIAASIIFLASLRTCDDYIEYSGIIQKSSNPENNSILSILSYSNLSLAIQLFIVWSAGAIGTIFFAGYAVDYSVTLYNIFILFTFYSFLVLLMEIYILYQSESGKFGLLCGFIASLHLFLPLIFGGIFDSQAISLFSLIGYLIYLFDTSDPFVAAKTGACILNILFCLVIGLLIWNRYKDIIIVRRVMSKT